MLEGSCICSVCHHEGVKNVYISKTSWSYASRHMTRAYLLLKEEKIRRYAILRPNFNVFRGNPFISRVGLTHWRYSAGGGGLTWMRSLSHKSSRTSFSCNAFEGPFLSLRSFEMAALSNRQNRSFSAY